MRRLVIAAGALLILVVVNLGIRQKEQILASGRTVLLELAPVDPRSLMQGDYMALRFRAADEAFVARPDETWRDGRIVLGVDDRGVGTFRRFDDGSATTADELTIGYRIRNDRPRFATDAFFFQEGQADRYADARYGEFRVAPDGEALLVALRGPQLETLGSQP